MKPKRQKHNYTSELELKSLLIRSKNKRLKSVKISVDENDKINRIVNKYVKTYVKLNNMNYAKKSIKTQKRKHTKAKLKNRIIKLSEQSFINFESNERFGTVILLMIKSILRKPNFSGYTYQTDFYSDAISKILKYLHNFDHTLISKISNQNVNSFAYISQIIHNSIIFVINKKKTEQNNINQQVSNEILSNNLGIADHRKDLNQSKLYDENPGFGFTPEIPQKEFHIKGNMNLIKEITKIIKNKSDDERVLIHYPSDKIITMKQYYELQPLLKKISIVRDN